MIWLDLFYIFYEKKLICISVSDMNAGQCFCLALQEAARLPPQPVNPSSHQETEHFHFFFVG